MATAIEQLVIDNQSRFLEMKSLQPYSTKDEYLYAMKEDLADWLVNMYPDWQPITAENFLARLENGVLLCYHANNVNEAARKVNKNSSLMNCKYRIDARPQTFSARDNVSQFIKWARNVARVREVLMFESDDLILRKNEKNFILCLLEIARYGAKFGVSVPAIIKLEHEIEREIQRDKYPENFSYISTEQNDNSDYHPSIDEYNHYCHVTTFEQPIIQQEHISNVNQNKEIDDAVVPDEVITTIDTSKDDNEEQASFHRTIEETKQTPIIPPASSSHLHKTVVNIINSCCCSQRFPVIRIGEGKYRIGENGTIIFIRILRNHVMVRVGGGWDTLENYLNKHDPCRRSNHHRHEHHQHSDIPIIAVPNTSMPSSVQKHTPFGKSITLKTEEFPLPKPSNHDTNLVDAQLVITRGTDGRHHIGQITYRAEEDTHNSQPACPHHHQYHHHQSSPTPPMQRKIVRNSGRVTPSSIFHKQSSPSTDQDYSSFTETMTTSPSKPSPSSSVEFKEELIIEQEIPSLNLKTTENRHSPPRSFIKPSPPLPSPIKNNNLSIIESVIGNIDGCISSTSVHVTKDFDINDIEEVMGIEKKSNINETTFDMDNDSLESSEGILEEKKKPSSTKKSNGYVSAFYLAQKQKFQEELAANRKRAITSFNRYSSRSSTLSNVTDNVRKDDQTMKSRRKPISVTSRSQSSDMIDKHNDNSKLDRDSGFDEQDFRRERLNSNGDDNSSVCSMRSTRSSTVRSTNFEIRENKSYELRMKNLDAKRISPAPIRRISNSASRRTSELSIPPTPPSTTTKYRKNSQPINIGKSPRLTESLDL